MIGNFACTRIVIGPIASYPRSSSIFQRSSGYLVPRRVSYLRLAPLVTDLHRSQENKGTPCLSATVVLMSRRSCLKPSNIETNLLGEH